jgi:pimeloyl-ACP methyl ester carboxylesterase
LSRHTKGTFGPLKHVNAGVLSIAYAEAGPADGPPVLLFHGWPYDIHSFVDVAPILAAAGYRVLVPYLRGYGETRFLSAATPRNAQPAAVAADAISFMDALKVDKAVMGGFDWGGRNANLLAFLWPERVKALVSVSGYLVGSQAAIQMPLPPSAENKWWYLFYFATDRGQAGYAKYTKDFNRFIWQQASPKWTFDDETFERSATAFENPDSFGSLSTTTAGIWAWSPASENTMNWRRRSRHFQLSLVRQSRWKAMRTAHRTLTRASMPRSTSAGTSIATSPAA